MRQRQRERVREREEAGLRTEERKTCVDWKIDFSISSVRPRMCNAHELDVCRSSVLLLLLLRHFGCSGLLVISTHSMLNV